MLNGTLEAESPRFQLGRATIGWESCIIDTFDTFEEHWTSLSSLSYNQASVPGPMFGSMSS